MSENDSMEEEFEFDKYWRRGVKYEGAGHDYYYIKEYNSAAEMHKEASKIFKLIKDKIDDEKLRNRAESNHYIELGNYYQSLASQELYKEKNYEKAHDLFSKAADMMKKALEIKSKFPVELKEKNFINMNIHFLLEQAEISQAFQLINQETENYDEIIERFDLASTHNNMETDFATQIGDFERATRSEARQLYCKGQINRFRGREALQRNESKEAKEYYLKAKDLFERSSKLDQNWEEYKILSKKMGNVAKRIRD
jgi:tetratricopeptide (TPR) repeat protein